MMIRVGTRVARSALLVLGSFAVGCHSGARVRRSPDVGLAIKDTTSLVAPITDTNVVALFKDTAVVGDVAAEGQTFKLATPGRRQALHATLRTERELWQARKPRDYEFLLRTACFCPGNRGWLLVQVRSNQPLRAWDRTGKRVPLTDWNTFSIDDLYEKLERTAETKGQVQIAFDPRWHFPTHVNIVALPGPDAWSIINARALRPM